MSPKAYASEHSSLRSASFTPADRLDRARRDGAARRASFAAQSPDDPVRKAVERHASSSLRASASEPWLPSGSPAKVDPCLLALAGGGGQGQTGHHPVRLSTV